MLRAFSTAATGMTAQQQMVDTIANNLANINTNGFKRRQAMFEDLLYVKMKEAGREVSAGVTAPSGIEIGSGTRLSAVTKVFSPGERVETGRALDMAINGDGFFQVTLPNGDLRYTRDGSFQTNAQGQIVNSNGLALDPPVTIPDNATGISVGVDGTVTVTTDKGTQQVGNIQLVRFPNAEGLTAEGGNLFAETESSGAPLTGTAGEDGFGGIQAGSLEKSNVQMVSELVDLITAQRAYEINSRAIKAGDSMLQTANQLIR
ncbi:Distal rod protein [Anaerohalosphaera lusitana]|uniref:Flagellar basal-body rod protein FlgG n=1 Tax=Anaerohalosphaera lusitana TaxID=1936003 RepID=A0A1U9NG64_9BACT|nr:flagellar basal-body rod protein FlgG [Anaerohalosphaera lusitana]AQT66921.1 Distal rod protein [Anaerohalosphaera lusitana]